MEQRPPWDNYNIMRKNVCKTWLEAGLHSPDSGHHMDVWRGTQKGSQFHVINVKIWILHEALMCTTSSRDHLGTVPYVLPHDQVISSNNFWCKCTVFHQSSHLRLSSAVAPEEWSLDLGERISLSWSLEWGWTSRAVSLPSPGKQALSQSQGQFLTIFHMFQVAHPTYQTHMIAFYEELAAPDKEFGCIIITSCHLTATLHLSLFLSIMTTGIFSHYRFPSGFLH